MNSDEKAIIDYLKSWTNSFVSGREISRKVGGKQRYEEDRGWIIPILARLVSEGIIESDYLGHFRLKREEKKVHVKRHVSPQLLRILKSSGKSFDGISIDEDPEDSPIPVYRKRKSPPPPARNSRPTA